MNIFMVVFINYGNTCYLNVILQIFLHVDILVKNKQWAHILIKLKQLKKNCPFKPNLIYNFLKLNKHFKIGQPHDAHEAFLHILDYVDDISFKGVLLYKMETTNKPLEINKNKEFFTSIELALTHSNLYDNLNEFFKSELISGWKDKHNNVRNIIKYGYILDFPNNLAIVLKQTQHIKKRIQYDHILDMTKYAANPNKKEKYELVSVIIHSNYHYYGYFKNNNIWYLYNDEQIGIIDKPNFNQCPYMLIYTKLK
mgnify:CR=1 FL=1|uniref:USP domain-containing protein n=1 Tax=viral metagenome TaxID=1070528 RepID=A0A6C0AG31_9ZZZZ